MLHRLPDHPAVKEVYRQLREILGIEPAELQSADALKSPRTVQIALFAAGVASFEILRQSGTEIDVFAGFSIGSYSAAVACGSVNFAELLPVVALRGERMGAAYPGGYGMTAILGLPPRSVAALVAEFQQATDPVYIATVNAPLQTVVSGSDSAMDRVATAARLRGCSRVHRLDVRTPSHCPLLSSVQHELERALAPVLMRTPQQPYLSNARTRIVTDADSIRQDLAANVAHTIFWHDAMELLQESGTEVFVEALPGHTLCRLRGTDRSQVKWTAIEDKGFGAAISTLSDRESTD